MPDFFAEFIRTAKRYPGSPALASPGGVFDYERMTRAIENIADNADANGLRGQLVYLDCATPEAKFLIFLGLMRAGVTVAVTSRPAAFGDNGITLHAVLTDKPENARPRLDPGRWLPVSATWFQPVAEKKRPRHEESQYGAVVASSGSTGTPKLIHLSRANLDYHIAVKYDDPYFGGELRYFSTAGNTSLLTLADYMVTLMKGGLIIQTEARSGQAVLDASDLYRPSYVSMAPGKLVDVLQTLDRAPRRLTKVDYLRLAGAYCSVATRAEALEKYAEHVMTSYGTTETGRVALGDFTDIAATEGSVGRIIKGVEIETVDDKGHPLPTGVEGELRIKSPAEAVTSYLTADGPADVLRDGWFYPGDLGRVDPSGQLIFTGRKSTVINFGGNKISSEVVEATLLEMPGVHDVAAAPVPTPRGYDAICAVIVENTSVTLNDIGAFLAKKNARFSVRALKRVASIPRTENGKIDRPALKALAESG